MKLEEASYEKKKTPLLFACDLGWPHMGNSLRTTKGSASSAARRRMTNEEKGYESVATSSGFGAPVPVV